MRTSLAVLGQIGQELAPVLRQRVPPARQGRRILSGLSRVLGARGGGLFAWEPGGELVLSATRGLAPELARRLRRVVQRPPSCPGEPLGRIGAVTVGVGRGVHSGWEELDRVVRELAAREVLCLWPLWWTGGSGLILLSFSESPRFGPGFVTVASDLLSLALSTMLLTQREASRSEDYRRIFENSRDMIYLSSRDGRWEEVNQAGVEMLGYESKQELLAVPDIAQAAYYNPADRAAFQAAIEKDGFVKDYEVLFKRKDGTPIHVSITAQVRKRHGKVVGYEGIIKDITARKRAEEAAERERALIANILELVPVAIFVVDRHHRVLHWNRACEELTGVKREAILGTDRVWEVFQRPRGVSLADVVLDQDEEKLYRHYGHERLRPSPLGEGAWEAEAHFADLGGKPRDLFFTAALLRNARGEVEGAVEAILDLTRLKELERSLAESEKLYRTLVEANREGIALHDGERFVFANRAFLEMFGLRGVEEAPADFLELVADTSRPAYLEWVRALNRGGGRLPMFEGKGVRGGESFDLEVIAAPAIYRGQRATLFTLRDVTYRKRMEEQLIRSERLAATGKLAFDIAHEVNNPLGGILTYAHLLCEDLGPQSEHYQTLQKIIKLTNRCKIIVRGLLDFARQDSPEQEPIDVNQVLREVLSLIEGHVILRQVEMVQDLAPGLPLVYGQRSKLEQVFLNLIINAAEAMEGRGRLELSTGVSDDGKWLEVRFRDNGPGMSEEVAARVFEPFFTTKGRGRGTGLGLSISHGIVSQHGGRIELDTAPGQGACFTVLLPLRGRG